MAKQKYHCRFVDKIEDRDPSVMWLDSGGYVEPHGKHYAAIADCLMVVRGADVLMQTRILRLGHRVHGGSMVAAITPSWLALRKEVLKNPRLLEHFPKWYRKFEEFVAGGYFQSRWAEVTLSPRSQDGGFDIAAYKRGRQILDEAKAYKPTFLVKHPVVRAALGLFIVRQNVDQVRVTTTSCFAPSVLHEFGHLIPGKLRLRDRHELLRWLSSIRDEPR